MKNQIIIIFAVMIMLVGAHNSQAEPGGPINAPERSCQAESMRMMPPPMRPSDMDLIEGIPEGNPLILERLIALKLDDKQKEAIREIRNRVAKDMVRKSADDHIAEIELKDLLDKDPVDMKAIEAKLRQIEAIKAEMRLSLIRTKEEIKSILTPEQRKQFDETFAMEPHMGPPPMDRMMRGGMRMIPPPPRCDKEADIRQSMEHIPHNAR